MLKIGEFSKLSRVSVRMLRHYDEIGLLKPAEIDRFTDYRYYREDQLSGRLLAAIAIVLVVLQAKIQKYICVGIVHIPDAILYAEL